MNGQRPNKIQEEEPITMTDWLVRIMNIIWFLVRPRKMSNFRWANTVRDWASFLGEFGEGQHTKIYGRVTSRYKYHHQQRYENKIRKFDAKDELASHMQQFGNAAFYHSVCGLQDPNAVNFEADLTRINDINSIRESAKYLYGEIAVRKGQEAAETARKSYVRGFSRPVLASDYTDWENLRNELRHYQRVGGLADEQPEDTAMLIAISYKGKTVKITRRMRLLQGDGISADDQGELRQIELNMTDDFLDDFRWSQLVRSCMALASTEGSAYVRVWIDRLVMMGIEKKDRENIYDLVAWEEFGLFPYAVCHVVRLYDAEEPYFGTDFWRKLESVLGVAGVGLVLDDYMLRKYDETIFFGPSMYERIGEGLCRIGGGGIYIRSTTLALATAVLTDGVSVSQANEDLRTKQAACAWKAWAIRTISEGAYSKCHPSMMVQQEACRLGHRRFHVVTFWESMVSRSLALTGKSYLDMSIQRSRSWMKSSNWDGVTEWVGMLPQSCIIEERGMIMQFLRQHSNISSFVSTTGHVASIVTLRSDDLRDKRTLVVDMSRFSTPRRGYVTAVAEATGLWGKRVLPCYLEHNPDPDGDQTAEVSEGGVSYSYKPMRVEYRFMPLLTKIVLLIFNVLVILWTFGGWLLVFGVQLVFILRPWPWTDRCDVGEAVFDNLLLHALYDSGIKKQYRRLRGRAYDQLGWI